MTRCGSQQTLWDAVDHYNKGDGLANPWLDEDIRPLALTEPEIDDLVALMVSLTKPAIQGTGGEGICAPACAIQDEPAAAGYRPGVRPQASASQTATAHAYTGRGRQIAVSGAETSPVAGVQRTAPANGRQFTLGDSPNRALGVGLRRIAMI